MKLKYLGHASFLITSNTGVKIITDPYIPGAYGAIKYGKIQEEADIVAVTHDHDDHNGVRELPGNPLVVRGEGLKEVKGVKFKGVSTYHDKSFGRDRGKNTIFVMEVDNIKIAHVGDLGHILTEDQVGSIGPIEVLLLPVGGFFTIDASEATQVMEELQAKITIPMHFRTVKNDFPQISPVEVFLKDKKAVKRFTTREVEISLPQEREIWYIPAP